MSEAFLKVVNMSISAGWLVLAVFALRLILKKAPKWVNVLLWGIVAVRLICPFSIESALSLIPSTETISPDIMMDWTPEISTGIEPLDQVVNPVISTSFAPQGMASANPLQILIPVAANLWLLGVLILLAYTAISYLSLRRKLRTAVILRDNIFQCETVSSPFVLGILNPRIYLPYNMDGQNLHHVVAHEQAHIRRKDHWWKPVGFLLLTVYWFNPLMWVAYILLCRDIELACDEKVIAELGNEQRADYTEALVACAVNRRMIATCPLAFGEVGVKDRVKSIMNYRKPTFWIIVAALVVCAVVAVCFLTNPLDSVDYLKFTGWSNDPACPDQMNYEINLGNRAMSGEIYVEQWINGTCVRSAPVVMTQFVDSIHITVRDRWEVGEKIGTEINIETNQYGGSLTTYFPYPENYDGAVHYARNEMNKRIKLSPDKEVILEARSFQCGNGVRPFDVETLSTNPEILESQDCILLIRAVFSDDPLGVTNESEVSSPMTVLRAKILEVHEGYFLVEPVEGSWELSSASQIEVPMKNMAPSPEPEVGDVLLIEYDGQLEETYPARITNPLHISVLVEVQTSEILTGFEFNFAGNTSGGQKMELTEDKPYWRITVVNEGTNGIKIDILGTIYMVDAGTTGHIYPDKAWDPGTYSVFIGTAGGIGMEGYAICSISSAPFQEEEPLAKIISSAERRYDHPLVVYISSEWAVDNTTEKIELPFNHLVIKEDGSGVIDGVEITWEICEKYTSKQGLHIELWDENEYVVSVVYWRDSQLLQIVDQNDNLLECYYHRIAYATG